MDGQKKNAITTERDWKAYAAELEGQIQRLEAELSQTKEEAQLLIQHAPTAIEEALAKSEEKFAKAFRSSPLALAISTLNEGRFLEVNDSYTRLLGFPREELIGHSSLELGLFPHPEERQEIVRLIRENQGFRDYPIQLWTKGSHLRDLLFSAEAMEIDGQACLFSLVVDVTERKRAEKALQEANTSLQEQKEELEVQTEELRSQTEELMDTNQKLQESRQRTQEILESISDGILGLDREWRFIYINQKAAQNVGLEPEQLIGKNIWQTFPSILGTDHETYYRQVMKQRQFAHLETDGVLTRKSYDIRIYPSVEGITVYWVDITERKQTEEEIKQLLATVEQEKARLQSVMNNIPDEVWFVDTSGNLVLVNEQVMKEFGPGILGGQEAAPREARDIAATSEVYRPDGTVRLPEEAPPLRALHGEVVRDQEEIVRTPATGELRYRQVNAAPVKDEHGRLLGSVSIVRDITERKKAEIALQESEEKFAKAFRASPAAMLITRLSDGAIVDVNESYEQLLGYSRAELIGHKTTELNIYLNPQERDRILKILKEEGRVYSREMALRRKTGSLVSSIGSLEAIHFGNEDYLLSTLIDITDRKQAEEALQQKNEALTLLIDAAAELLTGADPIARLDEFFTRAGKVLGLEVYVQYNLSPDGTHLDLGRLSGFPDQYLKVLSRLELGQAVCGTVAQIRKPMYVNDVQSQKDRKTRLIRKLGIGTYACHPLLVGDRLIGTLSFGSRSRTHFNPETIQILKTFCHLVAEALARKQAEEALQGKQVILQGILDATQESIWLFDPDGLILAANETALSRFHRSAEEIIGKDFKLFVPAELAQTRQEHLREAAETKRTVEFEDQHAGILFHHSYYPVIDSGGSVTSIAAFGRDITEQKRKERELNRLNRTLLAHSQSSRAMLYAQDEAAYLQEICRIINEDCGHAMVWIGYAEENAEQSVRPVASAGLESGYLETLHLTWADRERGRGPTGTAIRTGQISLCRHMLTDPAFAPWREEALKRGYASSIVLPLKAEEKTFGALTIYSREADPFTESEIELLSEIAQDLSYGITTLRLREAREQAEALLEVRNQDLQEQARMLDLAHILVRDMDSQVIFWNQGAEELYGFTKEQALGKVSHRLFQTKFPHSLEEVDQALRKQGVWQGELVHTRRDGEKVYVASHQVVHRDAAGQPTAIIEVNNDITDQKKAERELENLNATLELRVHARTAELQHALEELEVAEEELRVQNEDLEEAIELEKAMRQQLIQSEKYAALARLVASVAHEINNPLQTVQNSLYLLRNSIPEGPAQQFMNMAVSESSRIASLVQQLRETYRPARDLQAADFDLVELFSSVSTLMQPQFRQNNVVFQLNCEEQHMFVHGVPDQLKQVFLNLLLNAVDAMGSQGGQISADISHPKERQQVCVAIRDSGPGISPEHLHKIFEPFFTTKEKGTGLGLAICYEIIRDHGGEITAESEVGSGATFKVWLPSK